PSHPSLPPVVARYRGILNTDRDCQAAARHPKDRGCCFLSIEWRRPRYAFPRNRGGRQTRSARQPDGNPRRLASVPSFGSNMERFADFGDQHILPRHGLDKFCGVLIEEGKGPVVDGHHGVEFEKSLASKRCHLGSHRETVANWHESDLWGEKL